MLKHGKRLDGEYVRDKKRITSTKLDALIRSLDLLRVRELVKVDGSFVIDPEQVKQVRKMVADWKFAVKTWGVD